MTIALSYFPGQKASIFLETLNDAGVRADGYVPVVTRIIFPDLSLAADFPQFMAPLDVGLYYFQFTLPTNAVAIGSYLVDVTYNKPGTEEYFTQLYHIVVNAPYGVYSIASA